MKTSFKKHILIIGAGGLCHAALPSILNLPFEKITLMDGDIITVEPLHRQWIFSKNDLGQYKVNVLQRWILDRCFDKSVVALAQNFEEEIPFRPDLIFDFTDRLSAKLSILKYCQNQRIPLIHAASQKNHGAVAFLHPESPLFQYLLTEMNGKPNFEISCEDGVTTSVVGTIGIQAAHLGWLHFENLTIPNEYCMFDGKSNQWEKFNFQQKTTPHAILNHLISSIDQFISIKQKFQAEILHLGAHEVFPSCEPDELELRLKAVTHAIILCKNGIEASAAAAYFSKKFEDKHIFAFAGPANSLIPCLD